MPYLPTNFNPSTPAGANRVTQMVMEQVWPQAFVVDPEYQAGDDGLHRQRRGGRPEPDDRQLRDRPESDVVGRLPDHRGGLRLQLAAATAAPRRRLPSAGVLAGYRDIKSISGSNGGKTVTVVFKSPYSDWEGLFANLIPAHIAERAGWVDRVRRVPPVGADLRRALHRELDADAASGWS